MAVQDVRRTVGRRRLAATVLALSVAVAGCGRDRAGTAAGGGSVVVGMRASARCPIVNTDIYG